MRPAPNLGRSFIWLTGHAVGRQLLLFSLFVVLGRLLDPEDFGTFAIASSIVLLLQSLSSSAITVVVIRERNLGDAQLATAFTLNLVLATGLAVIFAAAIAVYCHVRPDAQTLLPVAAVMAATMPVAALFEIHLALLVRGGRFDLIAKKSIAGQVIASSGAVGLAFAGFGVWSLVAQCWLTVLIEAAIVRHYSSRKAHLRIDRGDVARLIQPVVPLAAARGVVAVDVRLPEILLGGFAGLATAGHFRLSRSLFDVVVALAGAALKQMTLPRLAPVSDDRALLRQRYLMVSGVNAWLFFAPLAVMYVWGGELTVLIFGAKWSESAWIVQIFAVQGIAYALFYLYEPLLTAAGRGGDLLRLRMIQAGLSILCMAAAIPFGDRAMIAANAAGVLFAMPFMYHFVAKATGLNARDFARAHAAPVASAAIVILVLAAGQIGLRDAPALVAIPVSTVGALTVYLLLFLKFGDPDIRRDLLLSAFNGRELRATPQT